VNNPYCLAVTDDEGKKSRFITLLPGQVVSFQRLDIFNVKGVEIEVVESEQGQSVIDLEAENKGPHEVCGLLQVGDIFSFLASLELNVSRFQVESGKIMSMLSYLSVFRLIDV